MTSFPTKSAELTGQVAIVTGGGRGIGRAIAGSLAKAGAKVAVTARTRGELDETVAQITRQGGTAFSVVVDVTNPAAVEEMVEETIRKFGTVDVLVNNAGASGLEAPIWEEEASAWWHVLEVNLRGPFLCARAVLPSMIARGHGRIINIVSGAGGVPSALNSSYPVSKAALFRLTDCLAEMTSAHGISVFAVSPGLVRTAMTQDMKMFKNVPADDWVSPELTGELCVLIASGQADRLSGRYLHAQNDIGEMIRRADEIIESDLYVLRLRK